ncbi:hypothetical protein ACEPPN_001205 [Leptodophora sp. 'Broadleaf-Isolate-01']
MVNDRLFGVERLSTAILSGLIGATATWLVFQLSMVRSNLVGSDSSSVSYTDDWTPQPRKFTTKEWKLFCDYRSPYIVGRFGSLRSALRNFVGNVTWKPTTHLLSDPELTLKARQYPYTARELAQLKRITPRLTDVASRESALTGLLSWIIFANISLQGSPSYTLLSPTLIATAKAIDGNHFDEFGCWAWEKARVYLCFLLCQTPIYPLAALCDDLDQQPVNPDAIDKLIGLSQALLEPFIELNDSELLELKRCFNIASRVGFGILRDLRPWCFSFDNFGPKETRLNDTAPLIQRRLAPFSATRRDEIEDFVSDERAIIFPALIALGDESGLRYQDPAVIVAAEFETWI